jgi:hypothetical protein
LEGVIGPGDARSDQRRGHCRNGSDQKFHVSLLFPQRKLLLFEWMTQKSRSSQGRHSPATT